MNFFKLNNNVLSIDYKIRDALIDYLSKNDTIAPVSDNRFIYLTIKMKRRTFIKQSSALIATSTITPFDLGVNNFKGTRITILHTNDVHSHIDPFGPNEGRNSNRGGIARRAVLVNQIRNQNKNTLLLDAGDIFQGTPYFNYYGGELEFKLMSLLKYDAVTIGNHDFDNGIDGLYKQLPHAKFDFLSANYDFTNTILDTHKTL